VTYLLQQYVLTPLNISFMRTITFILVIAALVQMVEIILKKVSRPLYQALGIFLPLITTNCTVLGVAVLAVQNNYNLLESVVFATANALGFGLALIIFSGIREQLELINVPGAMKGVPIAFITASLLALAFMGFAGIV
jgi:electron transport complex protein RnfA